MRAGCPTSSANIANMLPLTNLGALAQAFGKTALMGIKRGILAVVLKDDDIAIATLLANEFHNAIGRGMDMGACRRGVINPFVACPFAMDGMFKHAKLGADAGELKGGYQDGAFMDIPVNYDISAVLAL